MQYHRVQAVSGQAVSLAVGQESTIHRAVGSPKQATGQMVVSQVLTIDRLQLVLVNLQSEVRLVDVVV